MVVYGIWQVVFCKVIAAACRGHQHGQRCGHYRPAAEIALAPRPTLGDPKRVIRQIHLWHNALLPQWSLPASFFYVQPTICFTWSGPNGSYSCLA